MESETASKPSGPGRGRGRGRGRGAGRGRGRGRDGDCVVIPPSKRGGMIWSLREKQQLLDGLKRYSPDDLDNLCRMVPTRTSKEMQDYLKILKGGDGYKHYANQQVQIRWAPLESWFDMLTELVHYERQDLSKQIASVFSILSNFSELPKSEDPDTEPDYRKLYRYISALLDDAPVLPELAQLESAVMLDLLHNMGDMLRMSDMTLQRKVMCWKFKMLNHKYDFDDLKANLDRIRKAFTNDFSDLQSDQGQRQKLAGLSSSLMEETSPPYVMDLTSPQKTPSDSSIVVDLTSPQGTPVKSASSSVSENHPGSSVQSSIIDLTASPGNLMSSASSSRTASSAIPSSSTSSATEAEEAAAASHQTDCEQEQGASKDVDAHVERTNGVTVSAADSDGQNEESAQDDHDNGIDEMNEELAEPRRLKKPGRKRIHEWRTPLDKPRLYSMNPFCVPVRLLRFKLFLQSAPGQKQLRPGQTKSVSSKKFSSMSASAGQTSAAQVHASSATTSAKSSEVNGPQEMERLRPMAGLHPHVPAARSRVSSSGAEYSVTASALLKGAVAEFHRQQAYGLPKSNSQLVVSALRSVEGPRKVEVQSSSSYAPLASDRDSGGTIITTMEQIIRVGPEQALSVRNVDGRIEPGRKYRVVQLPTSHLRITPVEESSTAFISPLRAPLVGRAISVGTSDDENMLKLAERRAAIADKYRRTNSDPSSGSSTNASAKEKPKAVVVRRFSSTGGFRKHSGTSTTSSGKSSSQGDKSSSAPAPSASPTAGAESADPPDLHVRSSSNQRTYSRLPSTSSVAISATQQRPAVQGESPTPGKQSSGNLAHKQSSGTCSEESTWGDASGNQSETSVSKGTVAQHMQAKPQHLGTLPKVTVAPGTTGETKRRAESLASYLSGERKTAKRRRSSTDSVDISNTRLERVSLDGPTQPPSVTSDDPTRPSRVSSDGSTLPGRLSSDGPTQPARVGRPTQRSTGKGEMQFMKDKDGNIIPMMVTYI